MTVVAGVLNRRRDVPLSETLVEAVRRGISRRPDDEITAFRASNVAMFKLDVGAYGVPAFHSDNAGAVSMLAGEPLMDPEHGAVAGDRSLDLQRMHIAFTHEQWEWFAKSAGSYCAVHYDPKSKTVVLVADKLGLRPIYYWIGQDYLVFSSAMRVLESISQVPKIMDLVAVTEIVTLGGPVGNRTAYADIGALTGGEILRVTPDMAQSLRYWRWDSIKQSTEPKPALFAEAYARFREAVIRRVGQDSAVFATLSGGLDSRCMVAALRSEALKVHTLTFYSALQSQEQVFASEFADVAGTMHRAVHRPAPADVEYEPRSVEATVVAAWQAFPPSPDDAPERPQMLWTGNGGSVGVGHVYVEPGAVAALRAGQVRKAISAYRSRLVPRLLKPDISGTVAELVEEDIRTELESLDFDDPARSFYMFLMLFEQRHDLAPHFENLDLHRLEYLQPFFDPHFLTAIISTPLDLCLNHEFYTDWLAYFPPAVSAVPWQAYPGHRPCPLPIPVDLAYQWDTARRPRTGPESRRLRQVADRVMGADGFADALLDRRFMHLIRWMVRAGLRRGESSIDAAATFHRYWVACDGAFVAAPARAGALIDVSG